MQFNKFNTVLSIFTILLFLTSCSEKFTSEQKEGFVQVSNSEGSTLGYSSESGIKLLTVDWYAFKNLNKNGELDAYEDWRLSADERAKDLGAQMSVEQIAGLMLYSGKNTITMALSVRIGA